MVMKVAVQSIGERRCGTVRVEADNPPRATLATIKQAIWGERQPFGPVGVLAELCDVTARWLIAEDAAFHRHRKENRLPVPHGPLSSPVEGTCDELKFPIRSHLLLLPRSEEHTSELQSHHDLVCRLLLEKKKKKKNKNNN